MEQPTRYSLYDIEQMIRCLTPLFDVVRLVDPVHTKVLRLLDGGQIAEEPYTCFSAWNKTCRCRNCTSLQALMGECRRTKYEFIRNDVFYVVSQPMTLVLPEGERRAVLEIVSHVSDQLLKEREDGRTVADRLEELQSKLYRDELTRAFNRRYLNEFSFLHRSLEHQPLKVGLILLDLRQFKEVNDTRGHLAGDQVLEEVAAVLRGHVRAQDSVIRFGGDEFVVILTDCEEMVVQRKVEDLRQALQPVLPADFGYAYTDQFLAERSFLMAMLDQADRRMYEEKRRSGAHAQSIR
ncbi:GGDEF domain-containing protein [uncultured Oscillibacter sp.]|uniref:GGDEF domain-containing protein n=1 Tax=uncultured Oscillibacter sp. TaxID=876091 RepID=UPI0025E8E030|nr:GGDEF domain-containing protein [uncultured Oscillibacter sp.]